MLPIIVVVSLSLIASVSGQSGPAAHKCDLNLFHTCQQQFASALQIPPQADADWHNPYILASYLQQIFANGLPGFQGNPLVGVCNAYNGLIQCLGPLAPLCMDPLFLLDNDNTPDNAYAYIGIMNGLAFDCGAGFYAGVNNWNCVSRVYQHFNDTIYNCILTFVNNVLHDPDNACDYFSQALTCFSAPFLQTCPSNGAVKWFGCETWRIYLASRLYTCPATCSVSKRAAEEEYLKNHPELAKMLSAN